jgi:hypothetical protein
MRKSVVFSIGLMARVIGVIVERYAGWLLDKIGDGAENGLDLLWDFQEFCRSLMQWAASVLSGRQVFAPADFEESWRPGMCR